MIRGAITSDRIELDKLYFFIAVSVIEPTATPARKSNAQISFSQIERTLPVVSPPHPSSPFPRSLEFPSDIRSLRHPPSPLSHGKRPSGIFLARVILSTPFRSIAITSSPEKLLAPKMSARKSCGIQRRVLPYVASKYTGVTSYFARTMNSLTNARSISP